MDKFSNVFAGKAMGVEPVKVDVPKVSIPNINFMDEKIIGKNKSNIFGQKPKIFDMKEIKKMKSKSLSGNIFNGKDLGFKKMFSDKMSSFDKKIMNMTGATKSKLGMNLGVSTKINTYVPPIGNIGWKRMKQQKGLSMFGDIDRDGVPNILDCKPFNWRRQGPENNNEYGYTEGEDYPIEVQGERGVEEPIEEPVYEYDDYSETPYEEQSYMAEPTGEYEESEEGEYVEPQEKVIEAEVVETREEPSFLSRAWQATGIPSTLEERREKAAYEAEIRKKAREGVAKTAEEFKAGMLAGEEMRKVLPSEYFRQTTTTKGKKGEKREELSPFEMGTRAGLYRRPEPGRLEKFQESMGRMSMGFEQGMRGIAGGLSAGTRAAFPAAQSPMQISDRTSMLIWGKPSQAPPTPGTTLWGGMGTGMGGSSPMLGYEMQRQIQPGMQGPAPQPTGYQPRPQQQPAGRGGGGPITPPPEPGMVWSEKSQRWVRYTRKPYRQYY